MYKSLRQQTLHYFARPNEGPRLQPLTGPQAWRGADLRRSGDWQEALEPGHIQELKTAVQHAQALGKPMGRLTQQDFPLPTLSRRIDAWRREIRRGRGFVLVRGLPVQEWNESQSQLCYWGIGQHLGIPGAQNPQRDLLGHVRDQSTGQDVRLYRTNRAIDVHCDAADVVGLLCLQGAKSGGLSRLVSSVSVYNQLLAQRPDLVPLLYQPLYFDTKGEGGIRAFPIAPCAHADGELRTFWQSDYYRTAEKLPGIPKLTAAQRELLELYDAIAGSEELYLDMELQPGDMQLVSNHTVLHARTAYEDWPDPQRRRHLLRLWISMPEPQPLKLRWLTTRSWMRLGYAATRELLRNRLAA